MILTIAIPTYNRPTKVRNTLLRLIPQLNDQVFLRILDNHSETDVKSFVQNDIPAAVANKIEIIRHKVNIGGDSNFQRCFELCETPYIWMIGDDDMVAENAVELILKEIEFFKDYDLIGINFNSNCCNKQRVTPVTINSTKELAYKLDSFGNWLFISTSVYKTKEYLKYIYMAGWGAYSMASQVVPAMMAISKNKVFVLSDKYIVTNIPVEDVNTKWSDYQLALSLSSLLEAPVGFRGDEYKAFGQKLDMHFNCIYPGDIVYCILKSVNYNIDLIDNYHVYIYRQLIEKTFEFRTARRFTQLSQYYIGLFLLKNKGVLKALSSFMPGIKTKASQSVPFHLFKR
jgi:glycosyltransferase involved in cell wall biosynthesis